MLLVAADWELQFDMTATEYNQTKRRFAVEILGGDPALRSDGVIRSGPHQPKLLFGSSSQATGG